MKTVLFVWKWLRFALFSWICWITGGYAVILSFLGRVLNVVMYGSLLKAAIPLIWCVLVSSDTELGFFLFLHLSLIDELWTHTCHAKSCQCPFRIQYGFYNFAVCVPYWFFIDCSYSRKFRVIEGTGCQSSENSEACWNEQSISGQNEVLWWWLFCTLRLDNPSV